MSVTVDASGFAAEVRPWLRRNPITANVIATVLDHALAGASTGTDTQWITVRDGSGSVAGAAIHTRGHPLFLGPIPTSAAVRLAEHLAAEDPTAGHPSGEHRTLSEVVGPDEASTAFAEAWRRLTGADVRLSMSQGVYVLDELVPPVHVLGRARVATMADAVLCTRWFAEFEVEAMGGARPPGLTAATRERITEGRLTLWEDGGRPVSLSGRSAPAAGVARIGPVYTPPADRRRGYGAAVTAAATRAAVDAGATRCMLYTDLGNPTSNGIYQRLGYRRVGSASRFTVYRAGGVTDESAGE